MKFTDWRATAELIGITAIVASLIFVGLQLKQSQEIAIATQYQNRAEAVMNLSLTYIEAGYVAPRFRKWLSDDISTEEINTYLWLWISMDNHYYQYQSGFMAEDSWQAQFRNLNAIYANCALRFVWNWRKEGLRTVFVELVESLEDPCTEVARVSSD